MSLRQHLVEEFRQRFHEPPRWLVRAPGRVNLIGEHTDYNDGFVLPIAIDRATWIAARPRADRRVRLHSINHNETAEFDLGRLQQQSGHWSEYPKGTAWALQEAGYRLNGWEGVTDCDVPIGAGLSSSASYELAVARMFASASNLPWNPSEMARLGQRAENEWVGVNCGIMDQMISACGQAGRALLIDCRSLAITPVPLPIGVAVIVLDTATRRGLVGSAYNERRTQCEAAAKFFGCCALRDVSLAEFEAKANELDAVTCRRARHVISENERTLRVAAVCDPAEWGRLMNASHESLRDDFEVSNRQLDVMVDCARAADGCFGARMTGAGFGGCAVALVRTAAVEDFVKSVSAGYEKATGLTPQIYVSEASKGAEVIQHD